jgi:hypothetical protein
MPDFSDPTTNAIFVGLVAFNALTLGVLLALFRPGEAGYFARNGHPSGWAVCVAVSAGFAALSLLDVTVLVSVVAWWAVALLVFRLTVRQTIKLNLAQTLFYLALGFAVSAAGG